MTKISVIIPTYKNRGGLERSIQSVINQGYPDVEVIVVDDNGIGSSYQLKTKDVVSSYPMVKYIVHNVNKNGAAARNSGIKASTGEYIAFLDDDDVYLPEKLFKQLEYLQSNTDYDACYCYTINSDGSCRYVEPYKGDVSEQLLLLTAAMPTSTLMFRRQSLMKINGFDESFRRHQDYELLLRFFNAGFKIGCVEEYLMQWGANNGENILHGRDLEEMKSNFFKQFEGVINKLEISNPGVRDRIYAIHYSLVLIDHIKTHNWRMATKILNEHFSKGPSVFVNQIIKTAKHQISKI